MHGSQKLMGTKSLALFQIFNEQTRTVFNMIKIVEIIYIAMTKYR